jgi:hypothetical protein
MAGAASQQGVHDRGNGMWWFQGELLVSLGAGMRAAAVPQGNATRLPTRDLNLEGKNPHKSFYVPSSRNSLNRAQRPTGELMHKAKDLHASERLLSSGKRLNSPSEGDGTVCVTCGTSEGHRWCKVKGSDRFNCYSAG